MCDFMIKHAHLIQCRFFFFFANVGGSFIDGTLFCVLNL